MFFNMFNHISKPLWAHAPRVETWSERLGASRGLPNLRREHGWQMWLARCFSPLNFKLSLVGRGYSWMGDHLGIASC